MLASSACHPFCTAFRRTTNLPGPALQNELVRDRTTPIILPSGKNILVNIVFKIGVGYTNLETRQIQSSFFSSIYLFIMAIWRRTCGKGPLKEETAVSTTTSLQSTLTVYNYRVWHPTYNLPVKQMEVNYLLREIISVGVVWCCVCLFGTLLLLLLFCNPQF